MPVAEHLKKEEHQLNQGKFVRKCGRKKWKKQNLSDIEGS